MDMDASFVVLWGVVGAVIGWLASQIMEKGKLGGLNDVLAGLAGAIVGGWLFPAFFFLGGVFALLWATAYLLGRKIERERAAAYAAHDEAPRGEGQQ